MRHTTSLAALSAFAFTLAACGPAEEERADPAEPVADATVAAMPDDMATPAAEPSEGMDDAEATPTPTASASASATPTPTPSATRSATPTPTPTQAMAATPPASFAQCGVCHAVEPGKNGIGPTLAGVFGRRSASVSGFNYSPAMREANLTWNQANLNRYLADPSGVVPGTTMALPGISNAQERTAIINYLKTL